MESGEEESFVGKSQNIVCNNNRDIEAVMKAFAMANERDPVEREKYELHFLKCGSDGMLLLMARSYCERERGWQGRTQRKLLLYWVMFNAICLVAHLK